MGAFDEAIAVKKVAENRWLGDIPPGWSVAEAVNGGFVLALAGAVLAEALPHPDPLTLHVIFLAPAELGPVECEVKPLREGGSTSFATVDLYQGGVHKARVTGSCTELDALGGESWSAVERPDIDPFDPEQVFGDHGIELRRSVGMHFVSGDKVFRRGAPDGSGCFEGWLRFADGREPDVLSLLLFSDSMPPPVFTVFGVLHWVPTIDLSVQLRAHPAPGPVQVRFRSRNMSNGIVEEDGELWDSEGRLVALSRGTSKVRIRQHSRESS